MKIIFLTLLLLSTSIFASNEAILKLDTKGHTGIIKDIIVTKSGDIISASDDKTIRVWDSNTGKEKRKILGQVGSGSEGMIIAIALSNDERYLAVGGYMKNDEVRIYNYKTGKLLHILKSHTNVVYDLAFSKDNRYLISGSADKTAKIWSVNDSFTLKDTIKFHTNHVYAVKIIQNKRNYFAITAGFDNKIALYDLKTKRVIKSHTSDYKLQYLATSLKNGGQIATCGFGKEILIFDYNLNLIKTIQSETKPVGLAYSKNGKYLIAGTGEYPYVTNIYQTNKNYSLFKSFKKHTNTTMAVNFIDNNTAVSGGGDNNEIYTWDINTLKVKQKIVGVGNCVWSVGIKGDEITLGNNSAYKNHNSRGDLQKSINLKNFNISTNTNGFKRIQITNGSYSLKHSKGGDYGLGDAVLEIQKNNYTQSKIIKGSTNGYRHRCYGWYKDFIISGGSNGNLKIYNKQGKEVASLIGHTGEIWSIAVDGNRLVSGSDDQTMMVWDLSEVGENKEIYPMLNIFVSNDNEWVAWSKSGYFNSSVGGDKYVGYHINQGANKEARYVGSDKYFDTFYRPDIISLILQTGSERKAIAYASRTKKVKTVDVSNALPPVVSLLSSSNIKTSSKSIIVKYSVDSDEVLKEIIILHNGEKINARGLKKKKSSSKTQSITIELNSGENIISIKARNKFAMSDEVLVYATRKTKTKDIYKPTLYLLSVGVSKYENPEYNLGVADKDAIAMAKMFKAQEGKVYKKVITRTLTNKDAHSDNILDALDWIDKEVTSKDVAMIFIAGHGMNDDKGVYYFLSHDANLDRLRRSAVKWTEIKETISNLPSKVILLADTCHSGNITGERRDITSAVKSIINSGSGSVIMTATTGSGYSYEKAEWGHGAFTKSFLDGLGRMRADYDSDGTITVKEIDLYVTNNVKKLTKGKQKPTTIIPNSVPDFAIGVR